MNARMRSSERSAWNTHTGVEKYELQNRRKEAATMQLIQLQLQITTLTAVSDDKYVPFKLSTTFQT